MTSTSTSISREYLSYLPRTIANAPRSANKPPSHTVQVLFKLFFFSLALRVSKTALEPAKRGITGSYNILGPPDISPICFPSQMSYTDSKGWGAQCGAQTLYSSGRSMQLVRSLPTVCHSTRGGFFARLCLCLSCLLECISSGNFKVFVIITYLSTC